MSQLKKWALLPIALVLAGCAPTTPGVKIDPSLAMLIPSDTVMLAGVRAEALQKTPVYQKHLADRKLPPLDDFLKQTGLKDRKDLWELLLISDGKNTVVLGRGKFSDEAEPDLKRPGAKRFGYKGFNLVGDDRTAVLLVSPTVAGIGETSALKALIDAKDRSTGPPAPLAAMMKEIPPEVAVWAAYIGGPVHVPVDLSGNLANLNKVLSSIQTGSAYVDLRTAFNGLITGTTAAEKDATTLHDTMQALVGLGRLSAPKGDPQFPKIFDGIRVTQESTKVNVHIDEPEELVETMLKNLGFGSAQPHK